MSAQEDIDENIRYSFHWWRVMGCGPGTASSTHRSLYKHLPNTFLIKLCCLFFILRMRSTCIVSTSSLAEWRCRSKTVVATTSSPPTIPPRHPLQVQYQPQLRQLLNPISMDLYFKKKQKGTNTALFLFINLLFISNSALASDLKIKVWTRILQVIAARNKRPTSKAFSTRNIFRWPECKGTSGDQGREERGWGGGGAGHQGQD